MKVFLDTNIIIDFCNARKDFFQAAALIFELGRQKKIEILASATTFVNSFYILRKIYDPQELYMRMKAIADKCVITPVDQKIISERLLKVFPDFEDATQYYSAKSMNADVIITRNKRHFVMASENEVLTPEEFLDKIYQ